MADALTCSICVDVYRKPVSLPCSHSYCRECLKLFVERSKPARDDSRHGAKEVGISCPVCRAVTILGLGGVDSLPMNKELAESVEALHSENKDWEGFELCSMCEEDSLSPAVKFCQTCGILYCDACLSTMHPMRGPLKRHTLITMEKYKVSQNAAEEQTTVVTGHDVTASERLPVCTQHKQPFVIYCVSCEDLMCNSCVSQHNDHRMRDIATACESLKTMFQEKLTLCEEAVNCLGTGMEELKRQVNLVEKNQTLQEADVNRAYNEALGTLDNWRREALTAVADRYGNWLTECRAAIKDQQIRIEEMEELRRTSKVILSSPDVVFAQSVPQMSTRIDEKIPETKETSEHFALSVRCSFLCERLIPRHVTVKEQPIEKKPSILKEQSFCGYIETGQQSRPVIAGHTLSTSQDQAQQDQDEDGYNAVLDQYEYNDEYQYEYNDEYQHEYNDEYQHEYNDEYLYEFNDDY